MYKLNYKELSQFNLNNMTKLWLSNQVCSWATAEYSAGMRIDLRHLKRAYELWNHARKALSTSNEELYRVDSISTLKRCLNHRLKLIESIYALKKIAGKNSSKDYLGYLESFGIVRSSMLKSLLEIRNNIEHKDSEAPSYARCIELIDSVWYFLRSTDEIVRVQRYECTYSKESEDSYSVNVKIHYDINHQLEIRGWIPAHYISEVYIPNHYELEVAEVRKRSDTDYSKMLDNDMAQLSKIMNSHRKQDDLFIQGSLVGTNQLKFQVIKDALCAL